MLTISPKSPFSSFRWFVPVQLGIKPGSQKGFSSSFETCLTSPVVLSTSKRDENEISEFQFPSSIDLCIIVILGRYATIFHLINPAYIMYIQKYKLSLSGPINISNLEENLCRLINDSKPIHHGKNVERQSIPLILR